MFKSNTGDFFTCPRMLSALPAGDRRQVSVAISVNRLRLFLHCSVDQAVEFLDFPIEENAQGLRIGENLLHVLKFLAVISLDSLLSKMYYFQPVTGRHVHSPVSTRHFSNWKSFAR